MEMPTLERKINLLGLILKRHNIGLTIHPNNDIEIGKSYINKSKLIGFIIISALLLAFAILIPMMSGSLPFYIFLFPLFPILTGMIYYKKYKANDSIILIQSGKITIQDGEGITTVETDILDDETGVNEITEGEVTRFQTTVENDEDYIIGKVFLEGSDFQPIELIRIVGDPQFIKDDLEKIKDTLESKFFNSTE